MGMEMVLQMRMMMVMGMGMRMVMGEVITSSVIVALYT